MKYMMPIANKVEQQKHLQAIKDGMISVVPIIIVGSISLLPLAIANLLGSGPVYDFLNAHMSVFTYAGMFTTDMLSIYAAMFIAIALAKRYDICNNLTGATAIMVHLILSGLSIEGGMDISYLGASGLFTCIVSAILSVEVTRILTKKKIIIRLPDSVPSIEGELFLKVNRAKTTVTHVGKIKYLGYAFYRNRGKCRFRVHPKSAGKMKGRIREITQKNKGWRNDYRRQKLAEYVRGWINYYKLADMKGLMTETDEWLRRRIRAIYWKQWKKVKTRYRNLRALKLEEWQVHQIANSRKGYWRTAQILSVALTNKIIAKLGYISMLDYYLKVS